MKKINAIKTLGYVLLFLAGVHLFLIFMNYSYFSPVTIDCLGDEETMFGPDCKYLKSLSNELNVFVDKINQTNTWINLIASLGYAISGSIVLLSCKTD